MKKYALVWVVLVLMAIQAGTLTSARADVVGHLTEVTGQVDVMKGGKLPAITAKLQDGVEPGDVVRTKSASKALITFMDNSTMTIAPESKVAIEAYMFEPAQEKRHAVFQLFRGLAYVVVNKVFKVQNPDFIIKTHTAVMGVRGTEFGIRLYPASSTIMNFKGVLEVGNYSPEISGLSRKAFKTAFSLGAGHISWINAVLLYAMQGATVAKDLPPATFEVTPGMMKSFMNQLISGLQSRRGTGGGTVGTSGEGLAGAGGGSDPAGQGGTPDPGSQPSFLNSPAANPPPPLVLPPPPPPLPTYSFSLATNGVFTQSGSGGSPVLLAAGGSAILLGDLTSIFTSTYLATDSSTLTATSGAFPSSQVLGSYSANMVGSVSGNQGSTLTGSATVQSSYLSAGYTGYTVSNHYTVQVTIDPSGLITYSYTGGVFNSSAISGTSAGDGSASPLSASVSDTSETMMTMAASDSSTLLTATPASTGDVDVSPATTSGASGFKGTAGAHRRFGFRRNFFGLQGHHGRFEPSRTTTPNTPDVGFTLTSTVTDPQVPIPATVIQGKAASARAGTVTGTPEGRGRLHGVLKGAPPAIPVGAQATPPGSLTATPGALRPQ